MELMIDKVKTVARGVKDYLNSMDKVKITWGKIRTWEKNTSINQGNFKVNKIKSVSMTNNSTRVAVDKKQNLEKLLLKSMSSKYGL